MTRSPSCRFRRGADLELAFDGEKGTGAVDERAARFQEGQRVVDQPHLKAGQRLHLGPALDMRQVGVAADRSACGAGRIEQDRVVGRSVHAPTRRR